MLFELITWFPRHQFARATAFKIKTIETTLNTIRTEKERAKKYGATTLLTLHEASLYLLTFSLDHSVFLYDLAVERNTLRKTVYSKHLILLFAEFFDDFPSVFGQKIKQAVETLPNATTHLTLLTEINRDLRHYRKTHEKDFYRIRNLVAAHRDLDGELQLETLESIDHALIQKLAADLDTWCNKIWAFIAAATIDYKHSRQMISEVCKKIEQDA